MTTAKKSASKIISIDAVTEEQPVQKESTSTQLSLAIKPAKPSKLRMNITQAKAFVQETLQLINREKDARMVEMRQDLSYLQVLNQYMDNNLLVKALREVQQALRANPLVDLISRYNDQEAYNRTWIGSYGETRTEKPYKQDAMPSFEIQGRLTKIENNFFYLHYKTQLADMNKVYLNEDALYNRVMVSTINFVDANTLVQFQKQTIADMAPGLVRTIPSLDPTKHIAE